MDYKEKYEQALEVAKKTYDKQPMYREWLEKMFPELKESEDEKIREALIRFHKSTIDIDGIKGADIISWLEKQGEQKSTDKVELKFHEGEWITNGDYTWKIVEVKPLDYILQSQDGNIVDDTISHVDEQFHSFTIQDAKDGDVLYFSDETIVIFKDLYNATTFHSYCHIEDGEFSISCEELHDWWEGKEFQPATKEQRDILFEEMHKAGYVWDVEKKELKKINSYCQENCKGFQETGKCFTDGECKAKKEAEQKLVESEDEKIRKGLIEILSKYKYFYSKEIAWVKKQGKPSDEEMKTLLRTEYEKGRADAIAEMQMEWSEEDEKILRTILSDGIRGAELDMLQVNWLKSLRPQNRWKPSDEQMEALNYVVNLMASSESPKENDYYYNVFNDLRKQLKKLKEE